MKIKYLGTAAAESVPALFCDCDVCKMAMKLGGRNLRTRSQALIDDTILIDFPADTYYHFIQNKIKMSEIHTCIITHSHYDHLYAAEVETRRKSMSHLKNDQPLHMYATYPAYHKIVDALIGARVDEEKRVIAHKIEEFVPFVAEGYKITPLRANHDAPTLPVFYSIEKEGKAILYANDTGIFPEETWNYLLNNPIKYDLVSLDCTSMLVPDINWHMGLPANKMMRDRMFENNLADENTRFICNHFSHNSGLNHQDFVSIAENEGFEVSFDGMEVEI